MRRPDDEKLRALARETSEEMDQRIAQYRANMDAKLKEMNARMDALAERSAEHDRLLGIERGALHDVAYDGLASGDQGVIWDDFDFDQSVPPKIAKKMVDRNYGQR